MYGNFLKIGEARDKKSSQFVYVNTENSVQWEIRKMWSLLINGISVGAFIYRTSIELVANSVNICFVLFIENFSRRIVQNIVT